MNLFIVTVTFQSKESLLYLIDDLKKEINCLKRWKVEFIAVSNNSADSYLRSIQSLDPSTSLGMTTNIIKNKKNLGFAKGANLGIKYALAKGADRIMLLNPDTAIEKPFLQRLMESREEIVSPVIKFKREGEWVYDFGGKIYWNIGRAYHVESTNYSYSSSDPPVGGESRRNSRQARTINIDYVSGCCMLVKREVFEKIGLLDERFFLYFEDADFCVRAKRAGFSIGVNQNTEVTHQLIEGKERSNIKRYHLLHSNFLFINKYLGMKRIIGYLYLLGLAIKMNL